MEAIDSVGGSSPLLKARQFSMVRILLAVAWIALALAIWMARSPFNWHGFLDDDPDNIWPRIELATYILPVAGAIGSLPGEALTLLAKANLFWLLLSVALFAIGMARLF